ncbi:copper amine oxidase N-terminal domain-containing protein [Paenibacillus solani]|uniref:copper amine oxidase N-terminal domain-containing protein n=1 Tax=Paenibacillus solani TaxID=1705565 RepID=UPI0006C83C28|nr:copper amine oxidase N-terminal domain-containing protein [Paenibacillus solani]
MKLVKSLLMGALVTSSILGLFVGPTTADAAKVEYRKVQVLVDARKVKFKGGEPFQESGRVQVPLRGIGEALGAKIGFDGKKVSYTKDNNQIVLTLGSKQALVNGRTVAMDTPAKAIKGRTYVPLRFVSENLGVPVNWDQVGNWVWIGSKEVPDYRTVKTIKEYPLQKFRHLFGSAQFLAEGKENIYVFTIDDLPLSFDGFILYDVWEEKWTTNNYPYLKARFHKGVGQMAYLQEGVEPRHRSNAFPERYSDKTFTKTYQSWSENDKDFDPNWRNYQVKEAEYIYINTIADHLAFLVNPFK